MADDGFQRRAGEEGRQVQAMARKVLHGCGFKDLRANERRSELGVTVNFIGHDDTGKEWYFDVSGAFTSKRAGLIRTDTMWKTLGRANVLHQAGIERLVLLTTNLPKADSAGHCALTAAAPTFFDAIEMLTSEGKVRLTLYAQGERDRPLPGLRAPSQLYSERIRALLSGFAGGCTLTPGIGSWLDPIGGEMFEDVILVESYGPEAFPERLISEVVRVLIDDLGQHTAALIVNDAMVHVTPN